MQPEEDRIPQETPLPAADSPAPESAPTPVVEENPPQESSMPAPVQPSPIPSASPRKGGFWRNLLVWAIIAVVFFIGGVAALYFGYSRPKIDELTTTSAAAEDAYVKRFNDLTTQFNQAIKQLGETQTELDLTKGELKATNTYVEDLTAQVTQLNQKIIAYKFLGDVNSARVALERKDTPTARQAISFARGDLKALQDSGVQADAFSGFSENLDDAMNNLDETTLVKSRTALDTLHASLLLLIDNLP